MSEMAKAGFCRQCGQSVWLTCEVVGTRQGRWGYLWVLLRQE